MHTLEPYYNWQHIYVSEEDARSPFYGKVYSEFEFSQTIYNYYIHPQWDEFGSRTLYCKVLLSDYDERYAIIELMGEWNDALENDIMLLKRGVLERFADESVDKFILIAENVLNFHSDGADYYEELSQELQESGGWAVCLNMPMQSENEFKQAGHHRFIELFNIPEWRSYRPFHLLRKVESLLGPRLLR
jgi:hypothetical protein